MSRALRRYHKKWSKKLRHRSDLIPAPRPQRQLISAPTKNEIRFADLFDVKSTTENTFDNVQPISFGHSRGPEGLRTLVLSESYARGDGQAKHTEPVGPPGNLLTVNHIGATLSRDDANHDYSRGILRGRSGASHGLAWQNLISDSSMRRGVFNHIDNLGNAKFFVDPPEFPSTVGKRIRARAAEQADWVNHTLRSIEGGFKSFIKQAAIAPYMGCSIFHIVWHDDLQRVKALNFKWLSHVDGWINDATNTRLEGVLFGHTNQIGRLNRLKNDDIGRPYIIDAHNLQIFSWSRFGSNWEGLGWARTAAPHIKILQCLLRLQGMGFERYGVPWISVESQRGDEYRQEVNVTEDAILDSISNAFAMDNPVFVMPSGRHISAVDVTGSMPDLEPAKKFCLERIAEITRSESSLIGLGSTGAYASRSVAQSDEIRTSQSIGNEICDAINGADNMAHTGLIKKMIDAKYGPQERYPKLKCQVGDLEDPEFFSKLGVAHSAGLVVRTSGVVRTVHEKLGLPAPEEVDIEKLLSAQPGEASAKSEDDQAQVYEKSSESEEVDN